MGYSRTGSRILREKPVPVLTDPLKFYTDGLGIEPYLLGDSEAVNLPVHGKINIICSQIQPASPYLMVTIKGFIISLLSRLFE